MISGKVLQLWRKILPQRGFIFIAVKFRSLTAPVKQKRGPTDSNEPRLWNLSELLRVSIIEKLKLVNLGMQIGKGPIDALRELVRCTGL